MIEYYNYLTTPSGKSFNLKEMCNKEYLILLKFLNGENYKGFYEALDSLIMESIPEFIELDICDKAYIYIACFYYSVRSAISLKSQKVDAVEVPLTVMLDSIENNYKSNHINIVIDNKWKCSLHYPKYLLFDDNNSIFIDKLSGLREIASIKIENKAKIDTLREALPTKLINDIEYNIDKNFDNDIVISEGGVAVAKVTEKALSPSLFYSIAFIYKDMIENFYNMQYLITHYIRVDWESVLKMTPVETTILYKNFIDDKEKQNENSKSKGKGHINMNDPNVADTLMPY